MKKVKMYLLKQGHKKFAGIGNSICNGLSLSVYSDHEKANKKTVALAKRFRIGFQVKTLEDFISTFEDFLNQGYAGALLDDKIPIQFKKYKDGTFAIIRINKEDKVPYILTSQVTWVEKAELQDKEEIPFNHILDARIVEMIDVQPIWGWEQVNSLFVMVKENDETHVLFRDKNSNDETHVMKNIFLFTSEQLAKQVEHKISKLTESNSRRLYSLPVKDISNLVKETIGNHQGVLLNPFSHRALQGRFFIEASTVLMESYSGVWNINEQGKFIKQSQTYITDRDLNSSIFAQKMSDDGKDFLKVDAGDDAATLIMNREMLPIAQIKSTNLLPQLVVGNPQLEKIIILFEKQQIEKKVTEPFPNFLRKIMEFNLGKQLKDSLTLIINGYENSEKAPFEIEEVRQWYQTLYHDIPYLSYFLDSAEEQLQTFVLSLTPVNFSKKGGKITQELFQIVIDVTMKGMKLAMLLDDDPAEIVQKMFDAFQLEPDSDIYEEMLSAINQSDKN